MGPDGRVLHQQAHLEIRCAFEEDAGRRRLGDSGDFSYAEMTRKGGFSLDCRRTAYFIAQWLSLRVGSYYCYARAGHHCACRNAPPPSRLQCERDLMRMRNLDV